MQCLAPQWLNVIPIFPSLCVLFLLLLPCRAYILCAMRQPQGPRALIETRFHSWNIQLCYATIPSSRSHERRNRYPSPGTIAQNHLKYSMFVQKIFLRFLRSVGTSKHSKRSVLYWSATQRAKFLRMLLIFTKTIFIYMQSRFLQIIHHRNSYKTRYSFVNYNLCKLIKSLLWKIKYSRQKRYANLLYSDRINAYYFCPSTFLY